MLESVWVRCCLVGGTLLVGTYIIFGGAAVTRRRKRRRDDIPGLANIGNSCFLNALVQSLASCPAFVAWLAGRQTQRPPPLLNTLHSLLKALNNEGETSGDACAGEVLGALRGHGWVITSEEQDTHELFHVLTATIEDEIMTGAPVPSLLDASWLDQRREVPEEGVALRAAVWRLNTLKIDNVRSRKEELNGVVCSHVHDLTVGMCGERGGGSGGGGGGEGGPSEERSDICGDSTSHATNALQDTVSRRIRTRLPSLEKDRSDTDESQGHGSLAVASSCFIPPECDDNKNVKHKSDLHQAKTSRPQAGRTQTKDKPRRRSRLHHQDIPFRGYLASQLQCVVCGHKNPAQWSSFESLSLSLPSLPWGEVSLQELLGAYITREEVSEVSCDACTRSAARPVKTTFTKQLTIGKLPECLCFHVKRTVWLENGSAIKRRDHVTFPELLAMDPYTYTTSITTQAGRQGRLGHDGASSIVSGHPIGGLSQRVAASRPDSSPAGCVAAPVQCGQLYRLQAVIVHVGDVFYGHFVTYRRGPATSHSKARWFYTSDLLVREASLEEVRKANAYMILYEKVA